MRYHMTLVLDTSGYVVCLLGRGSPWQERRADPVAHGSSFPAECPSSGRTLAFCRTAFGMDHSGAPTGILCWKSHRRGFRNRGASTTVDPGRSLSARGYLSEYPCAPLCRDVPTCRERIMSAPSTSDWDGLCEHLRRSFPGSSVELTDETNRHRSHGGHPHGFHNLGLQIVSPAFSHMPLIERHRRIYQALGPLVNWRVHALQIEAAAPGESTLHSLRPPT